MTSIRREFQNENGDMVAILIENDYRGVTISAFGPSGVVEYTWTPLEAKTIRELLELLEPSYVKPSDPE